MKDLLKYLEENKNPNLKKEVNYGFEYCLSLINEYQALQLLQPDVIKSVCVYYNHFKELNEIGECRKCGQRETD